MTEKEIISRGYSVCSNEILPCLQGLYDKDVIYYTKFFGAGKYKFIRYAGHNDYQTGLLTIYKNSGKLVWNI